MLLSSGHVSIYVLCDYIHLLFSLCRKSWLFLLAQIKCPSVVSVYNTMISALNSFDNFQWTKIIRLPYYLMVLTTVSLV